ncbi:MAG TPA: DUF6049 family protein [Mycobacteriales bacterium]|nr:DUF6049 family protein [Mycobacteriales bacterium]
MTRPRRRRLGVLAAPLIAAIVGVGPLAATLPAGPAQADTSGAPVEVRLSSMTPVAPQPGDTLVLTGTLTNVSDEIVSNLSLDLQISSRISYRSEFDTYAADPDGSLFGLGLTAATNPAPATDPTLAPGASEPFTLRLPLDTLTRERLGLVSGWQVRELAVSVTGTDLSGTTDVGQLRTFLPWAPRNAIGVGNRVQVAWVWPLIDRPHRLASGVWFDDSLAPELSAGGRLSGLLSAGDNAEDQSPLGHKPKTVNVPVTWAIDPMLLEDVNAMTSGYRVQAANGTTTAGSGSAAAKQWLATLKTATTRTDADVLPLPYADPDVVAAARAGGFATAIGVATTSGRQIVQRLLGGATTLEYGWPDDGLANLRGLDLLQASGDTTMILSDTAVPVVGGPLPTTPSARAVVSTDEGQVQALLSDSGLDADVDSGLGNPLGSRVSLQDYLAETLMIQLEAPGAPDRSFVIAPTRHWDPSPAYAAALLADTGKVPWIEPVSLAQVRDTPVSGTPVERKPLTYPPTARRDELSSSYLDAVGATKRQIATFEGVLPQSTPQIASYNVALLQALSSAWRDRPKEGREQLGALSSEVTAQTRKVNITTAPNSYVTLTSHGGKVPVTVANNLDVPVSVIVHVLKNQRLTLRDNDVVRIIPAHQQVAVDLHASAKTSGVFPLKVELLTPAGRTYQPAIQLFVRSTVYGTITLVITGAATAALLVAVAIRLTRRALAARRSAAAAAS